MCVNINLILENVAELSSTDFPCFCFRKLLIIGISSMYGFARGGKKDEDIEDDRCWAALAGETEILRAVSKEMLVKSSGSVIPKIAELWRRAPLYSLCHPVVSEETEQESHSYLSWDSNLTQEMPRKTNALKVHCMGWGVGKKTQIFLRNL